MIKLRTMRWAGYVGRIGGRRMHIGYWWESQKERDHWKDQDVCVDNIKMDLREIGCDGTDWIHVDQNRNPRRALVNTVMKL
jgi:hypothetical protein